MSRGFPPGLLLITDRKGTRRPLEEVCRGALEAGFAGIMIREKDLEAGPLIELARPIHELCRSMDRLFLINDRLDVALALPGAGAHLGVRSVPLREARALLGAGPLLGYSAHQITEGAGALADGADYIVLGPVFPSISKPGLAGRGVGFLEEAVEALPDRTVVALGGIRGGHAEALRRAGAHAAAVVGAVMAADDPARAARDLAEEWGGEDPTPA